MENSKTSIANYFQPTYQLFLAGIVLVSVYGWIYKGAYSKVSGSIFSNAPSLADARIISGPLVIFPGKTMDSIGIIENNMGVTKKYSCSIGECGSNQVDVYKPKGKPARAWVSNSGGVLQLEVDGFITANYERRVNDIEGYRRKAIICLVIDAVIAFSFLLYLVFTKRKRL
jgi:hypothetical protein